MIVAEAVTALFVPGDRPDRFGKAAAAGADLVIIDLEDAVVVDHKEAALQSAVAALAPGHQDHLRAMIRINALSGSRLAAELSALRDLVERDGHGLVGLIIPKAEDPGLITDLINSLRTASSTPIGLVALIESARGLQRVDELAAAPGVTRLGLGEIDLALDVGCDADAAAIGYARGRMVLASRAAGITPPLASPAVEIRDLDAVGAAARLDRRDGFGGKLCIHPAQLDPVRAGFVPTAAELAWARSIVDADGGAAQVEGRMIDRPMVVRARRILSYDNTGSRD